MARTSSEATQAMPDQPEPDKPKLAPPALPDPVVACCNPRRVMVFGSVARGEAGPDSDIDLLVIVDDDTPAGMVTRKAAHLSRKSYQGSADVIPVRDKTFQENARITGTLMRATVLDGVVVYDRP